MSKNEMFIYEEINKSEISVGIIDLMPENFNDIEYVNFLKSHPNITKKQMIEKLDHLVKKQECVPLTYKKALLLLEKKYNDKLHNTPNKFASHDMGKYKEKFQNTTSLINSNFFSKLNKPSMQELMNYLKTNNNLEKLSKIPPGLLKKKENVLRLLEKKDLEINNFNELLSKIDTMLQNEKNKLNNVNISEEQKNNILEKQKKIMTLYIEVMNRMNEAIKNSQDKENMFNLMLNQQSNITESDYEKNINELESAEQLTIDITKDEEKKLLSINDMETSEIETKKSYKIFYIIIIIIILILLYLYYYEKQNKMKKQI